jgi:DNA-binding transcriptional regulator YdaS (Cro superfamily)
MNKIKALANEVGGVTKLSRQLGVSRQAVYKWINGDPMSPRNAIDLERVSGGMLTREELRPDIYR